MQTPFANLLLHLATNMEQQSLTSLLEQGRARFAEFSLKAGDLFVDFSRQRITQEIRALLLEALAAQGFDEKRNAFFSGEHVNVTENRAALHMALRGDAGDPYMVDGRPVMPDVLKERDRTLDYAEELRRSDITDIIHVGLGGSDLGSRLLAHALGDGKHPRLHFIGNIDADPLDAVMKLCDPARTRIIIASKTFTTAETMRNAETLRGWLAGALGKEKAREHMAATTAMPDAARAFGIHDSRIFTFWEWVGGRTSVCSVIGLPAMIAMGKSAFLKFLQGARAMDAHFREAPLQENLPVMLAALEVWNVNFLKCAARACLPYAERLAEFPFYLQQLEMESLGKQTDTTGHAFSFPTCPVLFGVTGTPAQHAFMQALHQGYAVIPADIICVQKTASPLKAHHTALLANALAQAEALARGSSAGDNAHKFFPGNRPSTLIVLEKLTPFALGQLIALFEHKVFTLGVFWDINPFDQWGVELGKVLAKPIEAALSSPAPAGSLALDALIAHLKEN